LLAQKIKIVRFIAKFPDPRFSREGRQETHKHGKQYGNEKNKEHAGNHTANKEHKKATNDLKRQQ